MGHISKKLGEENMSRPYINQMSFMSFNKTRRQRRH